MQQLWRAIPGLLDAADSTLSRAISTSGVFHALLNDDEFCKLSCLQCCFEELAATVNSWSLTPAELCRLHCRRHQLKYKFRLDY